MCYGSVDDRENLERRRIARQERETLQHAEACRGAREAASRVQEADRKRDAPPPTEHDASF